MSAGIDSLVMIDIFVNNETAHLETVVLGIPDKMGGVPNLEMTYDPKSREHIIAGTFPTEWAIKSEMDDFEAVLLKHGVKVWRPSVLDGVNQIFARDIGMVVEDKFIVPNIIEKRGKEVEGIEHIIAEIPSQQVVKADTGVRLEGGDVMPWGKQLFVGYSKEPDFSNFEVARTNEAALSFLQRQFPNKEVIGFELQKSDNQPKENALHLDCCFQPIGKDMALLYAGGFKNKEGYEFLVNYFGADKVIDITQEEMYYMGSNVFSINENIIVSEIGFSRINSVLREKGFTVETIKYSETAKMEGLLRCSTLPLKRRK